jgi:acetyl esterase/lipase
MSDDSQAAALTSLRGSHGRLAVREILIVSTVALFIGCSSSGNGNQTPIAGGTAGAPPSTASAGSGAQPSSAGATGSGGSPGSSGGEAVAGASAGGPAQGTGGSNGSGGRNGSSGSGAASGSPATTNAGAAGMPSTGPVTPPVRDTASKVPISSAPGYTVEGNYAYGPLTSQRLDVIYPPGAGPRGTRILPVVLMFHGGAWIHSYTNNYPSGKDHMSTFFNRYLMHGFMVCNAEYRVNDNTPDGAVAPAAVQDALLAAKWCWDHLDYFHGDKTKYVATGASAGGHLAMMVGMTTPAAMLGPTSPADYTIAAVVSGYGPADIEAELNAVAAGWIPASLPNRAAIAKLVSPITYVRRDVPPLIVVQGANDTTAPVPDSMRLVNLLTAAGADASIHLVPQAGHGFTDATWPDAEKAMFDWLVGKGIGN